MKVVSASDLLENPREILDWVVVKREVVVIERNDQEVARLVPSSKNQTALEVMADIYRTLPQEAAETWEADSRAPGVKGQRLPKGVRNPWDS